MTETPSSTDDSGTFCPECGKLRGHPEKEDATVTAGLDVDVEWYDSSDDFKINEDRGDLYIFVNHCTRCGYVMQALTGTVLPSGDSPGPRSLSEDMETFDSLDEYATWLTDEFAPITDDWTEEPIPVNTEALLDQLPDTAATAE